MAEEGTALPEDSAPQPEASPAESRTAADASPDSPHGVAAEPADAPSTGAPAVMDASPGKTDASALDAPPGAAELPVAEPTGDDSEPVRNDSAFNDNDTNERTEKTRLEVMELRMARILKENVQLCSELAEVGKELDASRMKEEELQVSWKGTANIFSRQKLVAENLQKSAQVQSRGELQKLSEAAHQLSELRNVYSQLQSVSRQLEFASTLQTQALAQCENKIAARTRRIRKLELAIYRLVSQAQCHPPLEKSVANLVSKCGPLVHNILSREAQRQALELAEREEASRQTPDVAASAA